MLHGLEIPMQLDDDITQWIGKLAEQRGEAADVIWREYFEKLVRLARRKLESLPRRAFDEEDVAISAMNSFFKAADAGRFPKLEDRDDLWRILVTITVRKARARWRAHFSKKRGEGKVHGESVFADPNGQNSTEGIAGILGDEPTPAMAAEMADTCETLLRQLADEILRDIVLLKLEGFTNDEIADKLNCTTRTVERKLQRIRECWRSADTQ